jgi:hypothetical protein
MGRLVLLVIANLGAYVVLRVLWPDVVRGRRAWAFLGLGLLSLSAWALPILFGLGSHGVVPGVGVPLKVFSAGWTVAVLATLFLGLPIAIARGLRERNLLRRAVGLPATEPAEVDLRKRNLLLGVGRAVPVVAVGASSAGIAGGALNFEVREVDVPLRGLPAALNGFRIGQITDVHVGPFIDTEYLRAAVLAMNAAKVDLQVMTGDLIDDLAQLDGTMAALAECRAQHGMLAVLGNHEHWRGLGPILAAYEDVATRAPVRLLVDEAHVLEHAGQRIRVVGVDYPMGARIPGMKEARMRESAEAGFAGAAPSEELVLCLTHHPDFFPHAAERGARLTLAGHTHGGQTALFGIPIFGFVFEYMLGRYKRGDSHLYVSGGTGHWMPFRIGVPTEVTVLTLRAV